MKFNIKAINLKLTSAISDYINEKVNALDKYTAGAESLAHAWVEVGAINRHHRNGRIYKAEIQVRLPGAYTTRAEAVAHDVFTAINKAKEILIRQLNRQKARQSARQRKTIRFLKQSFTVLSLTKLWRRGKIKINAGNP